MLLIRTLSYVRLLLKLNIQILDYHLGKFIMAYKSNYLDNNLNNDTALYFFRKNLKKRPRVNRNYGN